MEVEKIVNDIPKEIFNDVLEIAEKTFLKGEREFKKDFLSENLNNMIDKMEGILYDKNIIYIYTDRSMSFSSLDLQIYLAIYKLVKIEEHTIYEIEAMLDEDWYENEDFAEKYYEILHVAAKFNQSKFNQEYLLQNLKAFLDNVDTKSEEVMAESMMKQAFSEISFWNRLDAIGTMGLSSYVKDSLIYIGIDIYEVLDIVSFNEYEVIIKNRYFKQSESDSRMYKYIIKTDKMFNDEYLLEIFREKGAIEQLKVWYNNVVEIVKEIEKNPNEDYWKKHNVD